MPIVKANESSTLMKGAVVLDLADVAEQAARIRDAADQQARRVIADAQAAAETLAADAGERGFEQGCAAGLEQGLAEGREQGAAEAMTQASEQLAQIQQSWLQTAGQLESHLAVMQREAGDAVLEFAVRLGDKLVQRIVEVDPTVIVDQLATALGSVLSAHDVTVRISPDDRPVLEAALPDLLATFERFEHIRLVDDAAIARGGCVVSYGQGRIDAQLDTQLRRIVEAILPDEIAGDAPIAEQGDGREEIGSGEAEE